MTTLDELQRVEPEAVEYLRLRLADESGYINTPDIEAIHKILSERAELLATVERMRGGLTNAAAALGKAAEIFGGYGHNITARVMSMEAQEARAALTTGEAGSPIGQNDEPGLTVSDAGEP